MNSIFMHKYNNVHIDVFVYIYLFISMYEYIFKYI